MLVDTHTHIYLPEEFQDTDEVIDRAVKAGVGHMILPNVDMLTLQPMLALHERYPELTSVAVGLHPTEVDCGFENVLGHMRAILDNPPVGLCAVGEIGIDLYWDTTYRSEQREVFATQCRWAVEKDLPVIIHCREGLDDTLEVLSGLDAMPRGVFHSFGGSADDVDRIRRVGDFYFGINGIVTFKNSRLRDVLTDIGIDRILLETDSPYLAPVPHRGHRNESAYVALVARTVADSLGIDYDDVCRRTTVNAMTLFGIMGRVTDATAVKTVQVQSD